MGLLHRLNAPTGGIEKRAADDEPVDSLYINGSAKARTKQSLGEVKVERDPETGKILRVVRENDGEIEVAGRKHDRANPLNDPLNDLSDEDGDSRRTGKKHAKPDSAVVRQLELQLAKEEAQEKKKKPRHQSKREEEWILKLTERYGEDYRAMARDRKLNPMQQTESDLRRRIQKWKKTHS